MMQQHSSSSSVRRGDIVWARVQYPHRWFPALVLGSDNLGVFVSFFNLKTISPNTFYFVESEVLPFEETFRSIMSLHKNNNNNKCDEIFYALLQSALRLLGQRVIYNLSCRCQKKGFDRKVVDGSPSSSYRFDPVGVLGFVLNVAVSPSVDAPDSVDAVKLVAQIHAFRGYCSIQQKRVYRETPKAGDVVKLHPCASFGQKMHLVTQESVALEPKDEYQIISKKGGRNMAIDAIGKRRRLDKPALYGCSFTRRRFLYFSSISKALAWMQKTKSGKKKDNSGALISSPALANQACIHSSETTINFTDGVQNLTLQQSFACKSLSNIVHGIHSDKCEVDASSAKIKGMLGSNSYVYHKRLQIRSHVDATSLQSKESAITKLSSWDCLVEVKDQYQCVASCSIFNSKVGQQSKTRVPISSTSLYIKFPKNFNLPSKGELINKFNVFGSVNSSKTRVFCYSGSARVAFFHEADAVAAHLYARKKKVPLGVANVRFWLHRFEHKRGGGFKRFALMSPSASKPIGLPLKSCLKKSHSLGQENEKKHHRKEQTSRNCLLCPQKEYNQESL